MANGWLDLTDGDLDHALDMKQNGFTPVSTKSWTNTESDGDVHSLSTACRSVPTFGNLEWNRTLGQGRYGLNNASTASWSTFDDQACGLTARLYCIEQ